jgi:quercetin dioxygenase-like cupin family protein
MTTRAKFLGPDEGRDLSVLGGHMTVLATADETGGAYEVVLADSGPGGDIVPHRHPWQEAYFVLAGTLEVQVGRRLHRAEAGSFLTIPPRALHGFRVVGESARFLHVSMGRGATELFEEYAATVPGEPTLDDLPAIVDINARHDIEVMIPQEILDALAAPA